jgi:tRNA dimethylallyltransferase
MVVHNSVDKLVVIVGPTASGKSALALKVAENFNGEIICADSRTVYQDMDIGTAKPTHEERARVPHHCVDVVRPGQVFSVAQFKQLAEAAIQDIRERGKLPIVVGGTGLYVDALLFDFQFRSPADMRLRTELEKLSTAQLQERIEDAGLPMPPNHQNRRHLIRTLETNGQLSERRELRPDALVVGLDIEPAKLKKRIDKRIKTMLEAGLLDEVRELERKYGWDGEAFKATSYKAFRDYLGGEISLSDAQAQFSRNDQQLAKRQRTWLKRNPHIRWFKTPATAYRYIAERVVN